MILAQLLSNWLASIPFFVPGIEHPVPAPPPKSVSEGLNLNKYVLTQVSTGVWDLIPRGVAFSAVAAAPAAGFAVASDDDDGAIFS